MPQASEQEFQVFEQAIAEGHSPYVASRKAGTTIRRLKNGDRIRYENAAELSKDTRAAIVDERIDELVKKAEPPPALVIAWAKRNHPDYEDKSKVEISGPEGGPIEIEGKAVVGLADVVAFARSIGHSDLLGLDAGDARDAVPAAQEVLPDTGERKRPAGVLPPAEGA